MTFNSFCFNPLWVFQCAATCSLYSIKTISSSFNPLWVFQCAATRKSCSISLDWKKVSIPYGFSNALRQLCLTSSQHWLIRFNPLWVFQCAATWLNPANGIPLRLFQSLMGFPMRCDNVLHTVTILEAKFQSLMGFPMRCDMVVLTL